MSGLDRRGSKSGRTFEDAGCFAKVSVGESRAEVCGLIREATGVYVEALEEDGQAVPAAQTYEVIEV